MGPPDFGTGSREAQQPELFYAVIMCVFWKFREV